MLNTREKKDKATKHRKAPLRQQFSHPENLISQWWVTCRSSTVRPSRDQLRERQPLMHMQCQKNYGDNSRGKSNISPMACWSSNNLVFVHLKISKKKVAWIIYYDKMVAYDIPSSNQMWHTIYRSYSIKTSLCKGDFHGFPIAMFDQGFPSHAAAVNPRKPLQTWLLPRRGGCTWISGTPLGSQNMCCENGSAWYENWCKMQTVIWLAYITIYNISLLHIYIYVKINHGPQIRPFWASHMKHHTKARPLMSLDCFGMALGWLWDGFGMDLGSKNYVAVIGCQSLFQGGDWYGGISQWRFSAVKPCQIRQMGPRQSSQHVMTQKNDNAKWRNMCK